MQRKRLLRGADVTTLKHECPALHCSDTTRGLSDAMDPRDSPLRLDLDLSPEPVSRPKVLLLVAILALNVLQQDTATLAFMVLAPMCAAAFGLWVLLSRVSRVVQMRIFDRGIVLQQGPARHAYSWDAFTGVQATQTGYVLRLVGGGHLSIPVQGDTAETFLASLPESLAVHSDDVSTSAANPAEYTLGEGVFRDDARIERRGTLAPSSDYWSLGGCPPRVGVRFSTFFFLSGVLSLVMTSVFFYARADVPGKVSDYTLFLAPALVCLIGIGFFLRNRSAIARGIAHAPPDPRPCVFTSDGMHVRSRVAHIMWPYSAVQRLIRRGEYLIVDFDGPALVLKDEPGLEEWLSARARSLTTRPAMARLLAQGLGVQTLAVATAVAALTL